MEPFTAVASSREALVAGDCRLRKGAAGELLPVCLRARIRRSNLSSSGPTIIAPENHDRDPKKVGTDLALLRRFYRTEFGFRHGTLKPT